MINKTKTSILSIATAGSILFPAIGLAANLTVSSTLPTLNFQDTDGGVTGSDWIVTGPTSSFNIFDRNPGFHTTLQILSGTNNTNSLKVNSSGDMNLANGSVFIDRSTNQLGVGTTTPEQSLHIKESTANPSGTANIMMEWVGKSKWTLGTVSNGGFWLKDNNNANKTPFYILANSPSNSLKIAPAGVGIGIATPGAKLDVAGDIQATWSGSGGGLKELFKMSANNSNAAAFSDTGFVMENKRANFSWAFRTFESSEGFAASKQGTGAKELEVRNPTNVAANVQLVLASGASNTNGQWLNASSRSYKKNIHELTGDDAMQALRGLKSVKYQFKRDNSNEQMVGFIAEDVPALLATKDRKTVDPLQIVAVLTKAVQEQDRTLLETKAEMEGKNKKIAAMETKIDQLEKVEQRLTKLEALLKHLKSGFSGKKIK